MAKNNRTKERNVLQSAVWIVAAVLLIGLLFYFLNALTPLFGDDHCYLFSYATGERIENVEQIVDSQIAHYNTINGRSITHFLAQLFLLAGDGTFNIINAISFLVLLCLIYFHGYGTFRNFSPARFSLIAMLLFLSSPAFGESFLWITGASNYLYGSLIILAVLLPYRKQANGASGEWRLMSEIIAAIAYLPLGILAGWTNENTSVAMIAMMVGYMAFYSVKSIKIHAWNITGCIGGVIGCFVMLSAPGTSIRLASVGGSGGVISWIKRMIFYSFDMLVYLHLIIFLFVILSTLYYYQRRDDLRKNLRQCFSTLLGECGIVFIYLLGFLASVYSMIVPPQFPGRVWSGPIMLLLAATANLSACVDMSDKKVRIGQKLTLWFVLVFCLSTYFHVFYELKNIDAAYQNRISIIETALANHETRVEVPNIRGWTGYSCYSTKGDLKPDSSWWVNEAVAKYHGIEEIVSTD